MKKSPPLRWSAFLPALLFLLAAPAWAGSVTGRVLDANGKPVPGAKVQWTAYRSDDEALLDLTDGKDPAVLGETSADAEGRFRVPLDKPGVSVALARLSGGTPVGALRGSLRLRGRGLRVRRPAPGRAADDRAGRG